jgi:hypothetical protein
MPIETSEIFYQMLSAFYEIPGEFADIAEKTYAISQFLAKFLPFPISAKFPISLKLRGRLRFLLQITLSASWMTSYFKIKFPKSICSYF